MIISRIFLFCFLSVSWLFLSGFDDSATIPADSKINDNAPKVNEKKRPLKKGKQGIIEIRKSTQPDEFIKPLDLSLPFFSLESSDLKASKIKNEDDQLNGLFDPKPKKRPRSLELNGNFLMSPEPEVERKKTVDGAGISINVKPD